MQNKRLVGMVIRHQGILFFRRDEGLPQGLRYVTKRFMENNKFTRDHEAIVVTVAEVCCKKAWDETSLEW